MPIADEPLEGESPEAGDQAAREAFGRGLARALARIDRRIEAIHGDLAKADTAAKLADRAQLFVASAASAPRGARVLAAVDWSSGSPERVEMPLDPAKSASEQLTALFKRARRLREGAAIARERLGAAEAAAAKLREVELALAAPEPDLPALEAQARKAAPRDFARAAATMPGTSRRPGGAGDVPSGARPRGKAAPRPPYRKFVGAGDQPILVGRGAAHNDELTMHVARPRDLWLHAKNWSGAHVVVPLRKGMSCPPDLLVQAAHLAAHFSDAREEPVVEVSYVPRRYVRKPRGSAPGAVVVDREKVLLLRKQAETMRKLLESEVEL
jgi:predicted ribosome quality control (RQC) complex YloA/Tae2 family protein